MNSINWIPVGQGYLAIGHKPGGKISFSKLKNAGTSVVLTLLQEHEGVFEIGDQLKQINIDWIWFPFSASNPHSGKKKIEDIFNLFQRLNCLLKNGNKIYIHCSGGIHRTGIITYGLLRYLGREKEEALRILNNLRVVTGTQIGENRLKWGDKFYNQS